MSRLDKHFCIDTHPHCRAEAVVKGKTYRFTVLTEYLIRMEYSADGVFEDGATQSVYNRDFPVPAFTVKDTEKGLEIVTSALHLHYDKKPFSSSGLSIDVLDDIMPEKTFWYYGEKLCTLGGTARTLDNINGALPLEDGLISRFGYSVMDDSHSLVLADDGWIETRKKNIQDLYFFGYGLHYIDCLKDLYYLCGSTPMLPRYALGNWWSRYYPYSDPEYRALIERFEREEVPFSVAVMDMDWHNVKIDPKYGNGWTGYSWNRELFPDPEKFLQFLHGHDMKITLNLHPATGVRGHEDAYLPMAKALGVDYQNEEPIPFDITSPKFLEAYFRYLHHPLEKEGVDFWWIDWQQGEQTEIEGLDPLWMLNHYHYLDSQRNGQRGLLFSRYAGIGSHRYPVGFSGDTHVTWASLDFQPYFTATASNVGYGWWSHDIGGHMMGAKDDELATRWLQFGVFSPIMRLHSCNCPFNSKEPWMFGKEYELVMKRFLTLRHKLVPYIYTMNYYSHVNGAPLMLPMYYHYPTENEAYYVPNQYQFGTELMVCPITTPMERDLTLGSVNAWLPEGQWIDVFNGMVYRGNRKLKLFRPLETIPVLAKAGAIVPMKELADFTNDIRNPADMEIAVFGGADGRFVLYEDDGISNDYQQNVFAETAMQLHCGDKTVFTIEPAAGDVAVCPPQREYALVFRGMGNVGVQVSVNGKQVSVTTAYDPATVALTVRVTGCAPTDRVEVTLDTDGSLLPNDVATRAFELLNRTQLSYALKEEVFKILQKYTDRTRILTEMISFRFSDEETAKVSQSLAQALSEILFA